MPTDPLSPLVTLLAEYTDLANTHGRDSVEVREFRARHQENAELMALIAKRDGVQRQLQAGELQLRPDDLLEAGH